MQSGPTSLAAIQLCFSRQNLSISTSLAQAELEDSMYLSTLAGKQISGTEHVRSTAVWFRKK